MLNLSQKTPNQKIKSLFDMNYIYQKEEEFLINKDILNINF